MKTQLLYAVLAVIVVCVSCDAKLSLSKPMQELHYSAAPNPTGIIGLNLISGVQNDDDRILDRGYHVRHADDENTVYQQDIPYSSCIVNTRINYISVLAVGGTSTVYTEILSGGVGYNYVLIRLTSEKGKGYQVWIEIWGH